jgi:VWFA-related protein
MKALSTLMLLAAAITAAQQAPPPPAFHAGVQFVQVSVVAQDKQGKPVADLKREEFQILDNGSPREIRLFLAEASNPSPPEPKTPNTFTNRIASSAGSHGGYSVILIDNLFTDFACTGGKECHPQEEGGGTARARTLRMLRSIPIGERIAIYAIGRGLQVISGFTSDRGLLERQVEKWKPSIDTQNIYLSTFPGCPIPDDEAMLLDFAGAVAGSNLGQTSEGGAQATLNAAGGGRAASSLSQTPNWAAQYQTVMNRNCIEATRQDTIQRASASNDEMLQIADRLAGIPGRKKLIWLSNRFVISPRALQKLNDAGVSIYPVDIDGVPCSRCPPLRPTSLMDGIAAQTGGVAYYLRNDLDVAIREAMDDGHVSYTLGFYRSDDDRSSAVHQIAVRVSRSGVKLRYRTSYQTEAPPPASADPQIELVRAMNRPIDATAISIRASLTRIRDTLSLKAVIGAADLELSQRETRWTGRAEIVARFAAADGKPVGEVLTQTMNLHLSQTQYDAALQNGIACSNEMEIPSKAAELKLLFTDLISGKIGTLSIPLSEVAATVDIR